MENQQSKIIKRTGIKRILYTFIHSKNGFKWLIKNEAAFQQELVLLGILTVIAVILPFSTYETLFVFISMLHVIFAEMVNTAIEVVVDRIGPEYHPLSGIAKNIGSAIVFFSMMICLLVWITVLITAN